MDLRLVAVLLLVPVLDLLLLVGLVAVGPLTIAHGVLVVVITSLVGLLLVRAEGRHTLRKIQRNLADGELPGDQLLDGALVLVSAALFLTPGLLTDLFGLLLVLPPTRYPFRLATRKFVVTPYLDAKTGGFVTGDVYEGGPPRTEVELDESDYRFDDGDDDPGDPRGSDSPQD
ncbi:FxsA family protein [Haloglomus halophilum]|uniref:FxsA family protein n=1 Tax=Haloglomus halophilum TaxID=2962672 RepID=UPI0020C95136|nr:FxsA family protein [Haloglomus halophilum]